ncbi:unnamed protein product [Penicillium salamii]|nr:unnamed protein product [Penicillium salamii]
MRDAHGPRALRVIVKGKFADHNIPKGLQNLIIAESGTNDGLGYPFLFFALYLIKYVGSGAASGGARDAMGLWVGFTWGYTIILSILYGAVVGWVGKKLLHWAEERNYVDRESFLVFAIALALFVLGTCGLIGTDDVLACFIAGNTFTWDDWFRLETRTTPCSRQSTCSSTSPSSCGTALIYPGTTLVIIP